MVQKTYIDIKAICIMIAILIGILAITYIVVDINLAVQSEAYELIEEVPIVNSKAEFKYDYEVYVATKTEELKEYEDKVEEVKPIVDINEFGISFDTSGAFGSWSTDKQKVAKIMYKYLKMKNIDDEMIAGVIGAAMLEGMTPGYIEKYNPDDPAYTKWPHFDEWREIRREFDTITNLEQAKKVCDVPADTSMGIGIAQWSLGRRQALYPYYEKHASADGSLSTDQLLEAEIEYMVYEITEKEYYHPFLFDYYEKATSSLSSQYSGQDLINKKIEIATGLVCRYYEVYDGSQTQITKYGSITPNTPSWDRYLRAVEIYDAFK